MIEWVIEKRRIADLKPHPRNPRKLSKHDYEHLKRSLEKFGLIDKPIITQDGSVIGGHQRLQVLKKLKHKEVECWVPKGNDIAAEEIDELTIRLNRNTGEWDWDILADQWNQKDVTEWGFQPADLGLDIDDLPEPKNDDCSKCPTCGKKMKQKAAKSSKGTASK